MIDNIDLTYVLHGGNTSVLLRALANAMEPSKCAAWLPNRPVT